jgi:galactonate dehydratase
MHYNTDGGADIADYSAPGEGFDLADGWIGIPDKPGLGITMDERSVIKTSNQGHRWRAPIWRHRDGSISEW